jgi:hypothetical protein
MLLIAALLASSAPVPLPIVGFPIQISFVYPTLPYWLQWSSSRQFNRLPDSAAVCEFWRLVVMLGRLRLVIPPWTTNSPRLTIALLTTNSALRTAGRLKGSSLAMPIFRPEAERVPASSLC